MSVTDWARPHIKWFDNQFGSQIETHLVGSNLSKEFVIAVAMLETGYIWSSFRGKVNERKFLELCVADSYGWGRGRTFIPKNKVELLSWPRGEETYDAARKALVETSKYYPKFNRFAEIPNFIMMGYGVFQNDLLHYHEDPSFFAETKWNDFSQCMKKLLTTCNEAVVSLGYQDVKSLSDEQLSHVSAVYNDGFSNFRLEEGINQGRSQGWAGAGIKYGWVINEYIKLAR